MTLARMAFLATATTMLWTAGCASSKSQVLSAEESQVKLRSIQSRAFDTVDRQKVLRCSMATLQDLGFVIDSASDDLGTVTATKLDGYAIRMTVTVRPRGSTQSMVRANAQYNLRAIEEPGPYQQFFVALEKSMFLTAHAAD
jgi:hypothetical protein